MNTESYIKKMGGDWNCSTSIEIEDQIVDVYASQGLDCTIELAVVSIFVHIRATGKDTGFLGRYEIGPDDDEVFRQLQDLRRNGV